MAVNNGALKLYLINADNSKTQLTMIDVTFTNVDELSIPNYGGKFAIINCGGSASTYTLYEYHNL